MATVASYASMPSEITPTRSRSVTIATSRPPAMCSRHPFRYGTSDDAVGESRGVPVAP